MSNKLEILISGIGRSGTTTIFNVLGDALLKHDQTANTIYEPYLWNIRAAYKTATVKGQPFNTSQLNVFGIYTHTHTPIFLDESTPLHDLWLKQNFDGMMAERKGARLVKVIRGAGRLEATLKSRPNSKVILVTRNPVDTVNSGLGLFSFFGDEFHPTDRLRFLKEVNSMWGTNFSVEQFETEYQWSAIWWRFLTLSSFKVASKYKDRVFVLPYELYVQNKQAWMKRLLNFCGIEQKCLNEELLDFGAGPLTSISRLSQREVELLGDECTLYGSCLKEFYPNEFSNPKLIRGQMIKKYKKKTYKIPIVKMGDTDRTAVNLTINHALFRENIVTAQRTAKLMKLKDVASLSFAQIEGEKLKPEKSISVIISCFNNSASIEDAILSVLNQGVYVAEIIVADDCSTDKSRELITNLVAKYENVIPDFRKYNIGVSSNRDLAIRKSRGELITTLDGDDIYAPHKLKSEYQVLLKNNFNGIAFSNIKLITHENTKIIDCSGFDGINGIDAVLNISTRRIPVPRDMLFKKELYIESGGFNLDLSKYEDWLIKLKISTFLNNHHWLYSGVEGTIYDRRSPGLSKMSSIEEVKSQLIALISYSIDLPEYAEMVKSGITQLIESSHGLGALKLLLTEKKNFIHDLNNQNLKKYIKM